MHIGHLRNDRILVAQASAERIEMIYRETEYLECELWMC